MRRETFLQSSRLDNLTYLLYCHFAVVYAMVYSIQNMLHGAGSSQYCIYLYDGTVPDS